jgi:adenylosuccinate synthase
MPLNFVVGGQFGGEGKGSVTAYVAHRDRCEILIKTGAPNSAHTFAAAGIRHRVRMMPSGSNLGPQLVMFPAGCFIHPPTLFAELEQLNYLGEVLIDPNAGIVDEAHVRAELSDPQYNATGSTRTGTGVAVAMRAQRKIRLAEAEPSLSEFLGSVSDRLDLELRRGKIALVEGSQAFGLSNYHGYYPFVTSRDTTVSAFASQIGVAHTRISQVILVVKCFPTRNRPGNGPLPNEIFSSELLRELQETGGGGLEGGDQVRRVALFDFDIVVRAVRANGASMIALTGLDRLQALEHHPTIAAHYGSTADFIERVETASGLPTGLQAWGPNVEDIRDVRALEH